VAAAAIHHANVMGINPEILLGMGWIESRLNANAGKPTTKDGRVLSSAEGPWQIIDSPSTLAAIGITKDEKFDIEKGHSRHRPLYGSRYRVDEERRDHANARQVLHDVEPRGRSGQGDTDREPE
jgi:hypothetical protein